MKESEARFRPWGQYETIEKRKIIKVNPMEKLSLQYHNHRSELWKILKGAGQVTIGDKKYDAKKGDEYLIAPKEVHSIQAGVKGIYFLEIATGKVYEDDIVRLEDKYGRE